MSDRKPTTGGWASDAEALLEMGATQVDAGTVRGLLSELRNERQRIQRMELAASGGIREAAAALLAIGETTELCKVCGGTGRDDG